MKKKDVLAALSLLMDKYKDGVTINQVQEIFPPQDAIRVKSHIKRLSANGYLKRIKNPNKKRSFLYMLNTPTNDTQKYVDTVDKMKMPHTPTAVQRKALAIACEVCGALIGVKASDALYLLECTSCKTNYLFKDGLCHRLNPGIKPDVWTVSD